MMEKIVKGHSLSQSTDFVAQNIQTLKNMFPTIVKEGKIDIKELQALLGDDVETEEEYYRFTWAGKSMARREANKPSTATLRPDKQSSKDWKTTQNIFIEGDNLEVLKLLQKSYANKIKMIYIDPPYNTGKDFVYKDNYNDNLGNYLAITGQVDEEGKRINTNSETDGRYHSNWLNMMFPRLKLARNLLKDDGIFFISIDDNEVNNLKKICDEIFGEENFVACLPTIMNLKGNNDEFGFAGTHEYTLVYIKDIESTEDLYGIPLEDSDKEDYDQDDGLGAYKKGATLMRTGVAGAREKRPKGYYPIYVSQDLSSISLSRINKDDFEVFPKTKKGKEMSWRRSPETLKNSLSEFIVTKSKNTISFYKKQRLSDDLINGKKPKSLFYKAAYSSGNGTDLIKTLFGDERLFDNPKPITLISDLISVGCKEGIILDFFAGSGTTAHATILSNSQDAGDRKFICVQLPEPTDEKSEAYKAGYKTISEITKERIRRAGDKIKSEMKDDLFSAQGKTFDIGFRAFKLDSSNIRAWDGNPDALEDNLFNAGSNIKENRTEEDVLYEILLKYGLDLTMPIEQKAIAGKQVFNIGMGALFICLGDNITTAVAEGIGKWKEELQPATSKVIFKDTGFTDVEKTNSMQILKRYGILEVNTI
jgi:adenine-specific DNA-methyltransferase